MKNTSDKGDIIDDIHDKTIQDVYEIVRGLTFGFIDIKKDSDGLYDFYSDSYDELYFETLTAKITTKNETRRLLEALKKPIEPK